MKFKLYAWPLLVLPIISVFVGLIYKINFLTSIFLFFVVPSLYLTFLLGRKSLRVAIFSANSIFVTAVIDRLATLNHVWTVKSIFNFQPFQVAVEQFLWGFFFVYLVVSFYEFFYSKKIKKLIENKMYFLTIFLLILFLTTTYLSDNLFFLSQLKNLYMLGGVIIFILPIILVLLKFPGIKKSLLFIGLFFFFLTSLYEFVALKNGLWFFPGDPSTYAFVINFYNLKLPIEEFIYFSALGSSGVLSYFLLFD